jgi:hypothetical protein
MDVTLTIPDELAEHLTGDLSRRVLEALALEEYKSGHLTAAELRRLLGFRTRYQLDGFLKAHNVWADYGIDDFRREVEDLRDLGF